MKEKFTEGVKHVWLKFSIARAHKKKRQSRKITIEKKKNCFAILQKRENFEAPPSLSTLAAADEERDGNR